MDEVSSAFISYSINATSCFAHGGKTPLSEVDKELYPYVSNPVIISVTEVNKIKLTFDFFILPKSDKK